MKKLLALVLALAMVACVFAACGEAKEADTTVADETKAAEDSGKLIMATNASFPPYEFVADDGSFAGIDVEVAGKIAEKLGLELEIVDTEFGSIIGGVQAGKYDMGMAGMTVTEERMKSVNFSDTYAIGVQSIIVKADSEYKSIDDFFTDGKVKDGVKVGVQADTTGDIYCSDTVENGGFGEENVVRYKTGNDAVQALASGKVAVVIIDNEPAKSYVAATAGLKILDGAFTEEEYAICVAKENTELLDNINKALAELKDDGTLDEIVAKYIPAE